MNEEILPYDRVSGPHNVSEPFDRIVELVGTCKMDVLIFEFPIEKETVDRSKSKT